MARIDRVMEYVEYCTDKIAKKGVNAATVALELDIHRSDASADLNKLYKLGRIKKTGTRPVLYYAISHGNTDHTQNINGEKKLNSKIQNLKKTLNSKQPMAFAGIVGSEGSIKAQIELAKAAIVYPPNGLHTLICGESGVGKNLLAEAMWQYAKEMWTDEKRPGKTIPFVTFGCADYADNAQLLLAQLFGYVKGAFTGANEDHEGVVDRAKGGILFLDEIHRLPSTGQELLFMLVDKGIYRRLGETREERKAQLMIIGATSEDISSSLLLTFRRRIPVQITLPPISERPVSERIHLIIHFVRQEAIRLGIPILVSGQALETFTHYNCPANIGELRNDLQLCCAKSYLSCLATSHDKLIVDVETIPQRVFSMVRNQTVLDSSINKLFQEGILIEPDGQLIMHGVVNDYDLHSDLYGYVDKKISSYRKMNMSDEAVELQVSKDLEKYFGSVAQSLSKADAADMPVSIIDQSIWETANDLLNDAASKLKRKYGRKTLVALALHLQQFKERVVSGRFIYNPNLKMIKTEHRADFQVALDNIELLSSRLEINISPDELGFIAMFLIHGCDELLKPRIGMVIAAHGRGTAQSMAEVANNLLGTDHVKAYDIPLNRSNAQTVKELQEVILKNNQGSGVILLVDMGFLVTMENMLVKETNVPIRIIPNVTTALVLETGRRVLTTDETLEQAVANIYNAYDDYMMTLRQRRYHTNQSVEIKGSVLVTCASGEGVATKIKEILLSNVPMMKGMHFVTAGAMSDAEEIKKKLGNQLQLIVGSMDPKIEAVPFVHVSELFSTEGLKRIETLLSADSFDRELSNQQEIAVLDVYELLAGQLSKFVKSLSVKQVSLCCKNLVEKISQGFFDGMITQDATIRIYLHAACMFDRIHANQALQTPDWSEQIQIERQNEFLYLKKIVQDEGVKLLLEISDAEICYFLSSLPTKNNVVEDEL